MATKEIAEAIKSIADALAPAVSTGSEIIRGLLSAPSEETGGWLADAVRRSRHARWVHFAKRLEEKFEERGYQQVQIPAEFVYVAASKAVAAEDGDVRELWAELVTNGVESEEARHPLYMVILSQMTGTDARLLQTLAAHDGAYVARPAGEPDASAFDRLVGMGLVEAVGILVEEDSPSWRAHEVLKRMEFERFGRAHGDPYQFTGLGGRFVAALGIALRES